MHFCEFSVICEISVILLSTENALMELQEGSENVEATNIA